MGLSAAAATAIAAGAGALGTGAQMLMTGKMNRKTRAWNEKMMQRQRDWALSDYAMQNEYNSPKAQMARLKEAGLNPNLVYGNGADAQGGVVRSTDSPSWSPETPDLSGFAKAAQSGIGTYYDIQQQAAQTNLLKTQNTIAERDAQLKLTQELLLQQELLQRRFNYDFGVELRPYNLAFKKKAVELQDQSIMESLTRMSESSWRQNTGTTRLVSDMQTADLQREIMKVSMNKSRAEIDQIKQNIDNMKKSGEMQRMLNEVQEKMGRLNMTTNDPAYYKIISAIADKLGRK